MNRSRKWWVGAGLCAATGLLYLAVVGTKGPTPMRAVIDAKFENLRWIETPELAKKMSAEKKPLLLDVRTKEEFSVSHLEGAVRVDPDTPDYQKLTAKPSDEIVVYCSVGYRSGALAEQLQKRGFVNVRNLEGGVFQWANEDRPLVQRGAKATVVHPYDHTWSKMLKSSRRAPLDK